MDSTNPKTGDLSVALHTKSDEAWFYILSSKCGFHIEIDVAPGWYPTQIGPLDIFDLLSLKNTSFFTLPYVCYAFSVMHLCTIRRPTFLNGPKVYYSSRFSLVLSTGCWRVWPFFFINFWVGSFAKILVKLKSLISGILKIFGFGIGFQNVNSLWKKSPSLLFPCFSSISTLCLAYVAQKSQNYKNHKGPIFGSYWPRRVGFRFITHHT